MPKKRQKNTNSSDIKNKKEPVDLTPKKKARPRPTLDEDTIKQILPLADDYIDKRIQKALEAERPKMIEGLKRAIQELAYEAANPPPTPQQPTAATNQTEPTTPPQTSITPQGAQMLNMLLRAVSTPASSLESLATTLTQARAISDALNPPSIWDRVMQNVVIRSLVSTGQMTKREQEVLERKIEKGEGEKIT